MNRDNLLYIILGIVAVVLVGVTIGLQVTIMMNRSGDTAGGLDTERARTLTERVRAVLQTSTPVPQSVAVPRVALLPTLTSFPPTPTLPPTSIPTITPLPTVVSPTPTPTGNASNLIASNAELSPRDRMLNAENLIASEDDNALVNIIRDEPNAIGFFGYSFFRDNQDSLRAIRIQIDGGLSVEASADSVFAGLYPLTRPLFIYAAVDSLQRPEVESFVGCYLNRINDEIVNIGYFPVGPAAFQTALNTLDAHCQRCQKADLLPACNLDNVPPNNITIAGSSTVYPITQRMADRFREDGFNGAIRVDSIGSGAGFRRLCITADTDIANASRAIQETEMTSCQAIGRTPLAFPIGIDAITVVVSRQNSFIDDITIAQLQRIFTDARTWSDINPVWPNELIVRAIPGRDSGTLDFFISTVFVKEDNQQTASIVDNPVIVTPTSVPPTATDQTAGETSSQGTKELVLGVTERGSNCTLVTEIMAQILAEDLQVLVQQQRFETPELLFNALSDGQVDVTFCYVDPEDRQLMREYLGNIRQMGIQYHVGNGFKLQVWANSQSKAYLRDQMPCIYDLLEKVSIEDENLQNLQVQGWRQQNATTIATWLDCPYSQQENN